MKLTLGFSPNPSDTFIFDAMVHGRIDTEGLEFDYFFAEAEALNKKALNAGADIMRMSFHTFAYAAMNYLILDSGSTLGYRIGPLLISKRIINTSELNDIRIAIPGKYSTANLLFSVAWPEAKNKMEYLFSDVEKALLNDEIDAGLIIHETRFTYLKRGLHKIADMGEYWEHLSGLPVPLTAIAINRKIPEDIALKVNRIIKRSLEFAYTDSLPSYDFVTGNSKDMDSTVMNSHIKLFVNEFSVNLGKTGKKAVNEFFRIAHEKEIIPSLPLRIFLTEE